jgi:hypothetical protein
MQILWMQFENQPPAVHFLVTTFKERPEITEAVLESIFAECRAARVPARIFVATGDASDECVIEDYLHEMHRNRLQNRWISGERLLRRNNLRSWRRA